MDSHREDIPYHSVPESLAKYSTGQESAAQRRRLLASARKDSDDDGTERVSPSQQSSSQQDTRPSTLDRQISHMAETGETRAERRRRLAALGGEEESDSDDDGAPRQPKHTPVPEPSRSEGEREIRTPGIRFADTPAVSQGRVQWGEDVGRRGRRS